MQKNKNRLIPLSRFAKEGQYNAAYLSLLVQRKKLKAERIGRNYFTTKAWFDEYLFQHARKEKMILSDTIENDAAKLKEKLTRPKKTLLRGLFGVSFFVGQKVNKAKAETAKKLNGRAWLTRLIISSWFMLILAFYMVRYLPVGAAIVISAADKIYLAPAKFAMHIYSDYHPERLIGSYDLKTKAVGASDQIIR